MRTHACVLIWLLAAGTSVAAGGPSIEGRVVITRVLTKRRVTLPIYGLRGMSPGSSYDPARGAPVDSTIDELSRVVVYLEGAGLKAGEPVTATLSQQDKRFVPDIVVVPAGSTVSFPNRDPIFHNVFSLSRAKSFDLGYYPQGETRTVRFDRPGIVEVYCHIHPDMSAAIVVVPTAWWAQPKGNGSFSFSGVPRGSYTIVAWHRSAGFFRHRVTVSGDASQSIDFTIPVRDSAPRGTAKVGS